MNNFIERYNSVNTNENIEFELSFNCVYKDFIYKNIFNKLKSMTDKIYIIENIDVYYGDIRKILIFQNGVNTNKQVIMKKKQLLPFIKIRKNINNVLSNKLKLNNEIECKLTSTIITDIRLKLRVRFEISKNYTFDLDLIKRIDVSNNKLKEIKDELFRNYTIESMIENINYSLFDEMKLEIEYHGEMTKDLLFNSVDIVSSLFETPNDDYQNMIYKIGKRIINNKSYLENFRNKSGLKKLLNNVLELNVEKFYKDIQPNITNYYITDKIDGLRCICYIDENIESNKISIKLINNKLYHLNEIIDIEYVNSDINKTTIFDCELIYKNDKYLTNNILSNEDVELYLFDVIMFENENLGFKPFEYRINYLDKCQLKVNSFSKTKEYIELNDDWKEQLQNFYKKKLKSKYEIDGLIFTPKSSVKGNSKYPINTTYSNMIGYKWKPAEHLTIDFWVKQVPKHIYTHIPFNSIKKIDDDNIYVLFSGISLDDYHKLGLNYMNNYKTITGDIKTGPLIPIQFSTSDNPINYIYISHMDNLDNKICEFGYNKKENVWEFKKIRIDRDVELSRGEYYGNYYKVSEMIWNSIKHPLTLDLMISDNNSYFNGDNSESSNLYKAQRNYNSFVKNQLIEISDTDKNFVFDIAAGKGQDMARLANLGYKNGLFLDNDANALLELVNRKHNLKSFSKNKMIINFENINLLDDYKTNIKKLEKFNYEKESIDLVICNFAIHYIAYNPDYINNLINFISYYLKPFGTFIFTCFNGKKIFDLLNSSETNSWNLYENDILKYSIQGLSSEKEFLNFGQKIKVLLPFSNNEYYEEYLMNIDFINNCFIDNSYNLETSNDFDIFLDNFKHANNKVFNQLSQNDLDFVSLYGFSIFTKGNTNSKNGNIIIKKSTKISKSIPMREVVGSSENNSNLYLLDNVHNSNRIFIFVSNNKTKDTIISKMNDINYNNLENNSKLKKNTYKVFLNYDTSINLKTLINIHKLRLKPISNTSIIIIDNEINTNTNINYNYLIKKPISPIILNENIYIIDLNSISQYDRITLSFVKELIKDEMIIHD